VQNIDVKIVDQRQQPAEAGRHPMHAADRDSREIEHPHIDSARAQALGKVALRRYERTRTKPAPIQRRG
jgi:hypothetical protein